MVCKGSSKIFIYLYFICGFYAEIIKDSMYTSSMVFMQSSIKTLCIYISSMVFLQSSITTLCIMYTLSMVFMQRLITTLCILSLCFCTKFYKESMYTLSKVFM